MSRDTLSIVLKSVSKSRVAIIGCILVAILLPVLSASLILDLLGLVKNPYFGFLTYMIIGPLFAVGLIMIILGIFFLPSNDEEIGLYAFEYIKEQLTLPGRLSRVRRLLGTVYFLSFFIVLVVVVVSYTGFRYTETVSFCTQFCHQAMEPELVSYRNSPHSQIPCVHCHIGESAGLKAKSKISGINQIFAVTFDTYSRPIKTPTEGLRPTQATCVQCHRPETFHGDKLHIKHRYQADEQNSDLQTILLVQIGSGGYRGEQANGIHWHISPQQKIYYTHTDRERKDIIEVKVVKNDGSERVFTRREKTAATEATAITRLMDCIDCHNRPTHIFLSPDEALDRRIASGEISQQIPYIKRQAKAAITQQYANSQEAQIAITRQLHGWYGQNYPEYAGEKKPLLDRAIQGIYQAYAENVFPEMNVTWNTYENFAGHQDSPGCFRCHNPQFADETGNSISHDCRTCHVVLAHEESDPEILRTLRGK
ncbi:NapC/NirT family cytochrome c [Desulfurivibrio sp. D14AmB]|uniref:NapC/NirT family cytochrome c n=1 Tax=Desulfurivibrio sp. D14AmB TaxID=3374370 RepID=UPI00376EDF5A